MTAEQLAYWLQGFAEIHGEPPTAEQWQIIKDHLAEVFVKVTPQRSPQGLGGLQGLIGQCQLNGNLNNPLGNQC